jgi:hypothetical protein
VRHVRMMGLCLAAACAIAAVLASSASAGLPEFGKCEPKTGGKYSNSNCTTKAKKGAGAYEWLNAEHFSGAVKEFSNGSGEKTPAVLTSRFIACFTGYERLPKCREDEKEEEYATVKIECEEVYDNGEFSSKSDKEVRNVHVTFKECKGIGTECTNTATAGVIETNLLEGTLGYIKKTAPKEVGVDIKPQSGSIFAEFHCGGQIGTVVGGAKATEGPAHPPSGGGDGIIGTVTPINEMTSTISQAFVVNEETFENIPNKFEGKPVQVLEDYLTFLGNPGHGSKWSAAGEAVSVHNSCKACKAGEGVGEVKA